MIKINKDDNISNCTPEEKIATKKQQHRPCNFDFGLFAGYPPKSPIYVTISKNM